MPKPQTVRPGDTFATLSARAYGTDRYADLIAQANPGTIEPLSAGAVLAIPKQPGASPDHPQAVPSSAPDEVAILIDGKRFRYWESARIVRGIDRIDTVEFSAPFDHTAPGFREAFRPFSYKPLAVYVGGDLLFSGTLIGVVPSLEKDKKSIQVSAYSRPGVLQDCTPQSSAYPVEFDGQTLPRIAEKLAAPFGIDVVFTGPRGAAFEQVSANPGTNILSFLSGLAKQRGLIISSTPDGKLIFQQSITPGKPAVILEQGKSPLLGVSPTFSPQEYYSSITGLESVYVGTAGSQYTVKNPHLSGAIRPLTFNVPDVTGGDVKQAVAAKVGHMFGNMAAYSTQVDTWRDSSGALLAPNTTVRLTAPDAMVYSPYEFVVRSVSFERNGDTASASLDLVLPGSFSGKVPESLPWD